MIYYLVTGEYRNTIDGFLRSNGRALLGSIRPVAYERVLDARTVPTGVYLFTDLERLMPREAERAAALWQRLEAAGPSVRLANHPTRAMRRYALLRDLHECGVNQSDVVRVTDTRVPRRFPVFIRVENDHAGSCTELLHGPEDLTAAIAAMDREGKSREDAIIVEFCATANAHGIYRKYAAFLVNGRIIPRHLFFASQWQVKQPERLDADLVREELAYVQDNPHASELKTIFNRARIDYGRIDYGLCDGRIQVWEINTNPLLPSDLAPGGAARQRTNSVCTERLIQAFTELNAAPSGPAIRIATGLTRRPRTPIATRTKRALRRGIDRLVFRVASARGARAPRGPVV